MVLRFEERKHGDLHEEDFCLLYKETITLRTTGEKWERAGMGFVSVLWNASISIF
jgi:hypothetical protein